MCVLLPSASISTDVLENFLITGFSPIHTAIRQIGNTIISNLFIDNFLDIIILIRITAVTKLHIPILEPDKISAEDITNIRNERSPALVPIKFIICTSL